MAWKTSGFYAQAACGMGVTMLRRRVSLIIWARGRICFKDLRVVSYTLLYCIIHHSCDINSGVCAYRLLIQGTIRVTQMSSEYGKYSGRYRVVSELCLTIGPLV